MRFDTAVRGDVVSLLRVLSWRLALLVLVSAVFGCASTDPRVQKEDVLGTLGVFHRDQDQDETLPPGISRDDGISMSESVAIALYRNAAFQAELARLGVAQADITVAGKLPNPMLSLLLPSGPKQTEATLNWPLQALLLRPRKVEMAQLDLQQVGESLVDNGLRLIEQVKVAHSATVAARTLEVLARDRESRLKEVADLMAARLRSGDVSGLESDSARTSALAGADDRSQSRYEAAASLSKLRDLLGLDDLSLAELLIEDDPGDPQAELPSEDQLADDLIEKALLARPDMRAAELAVERAATELGLTGAQVLTLSGILDANWKGRDGFELGPGLALLIPVLDAGGADRGRSLAMLELQMRREVAIRHRIRVEVEDSLHQHTRARNAYRFSRTELVPRLAKSLEETKHAYTGGESSYLTVALSELALIDARIREARDRALLDRARASFEARVGASLVEKEP